MYIYTNCILNVYMTHPGKQRSMRMLYTGISKKNCVRKKTFDELLAVFAWDLEHLATGKRATCRHDGTPWNATDSARAKLAAKEPDLPFRAALCEVRGDWKFYKECFDFPAWNTLQGIIPIHISLRICMPPSLRGGCKQGGGKGGEGGGLATTYHMTCRYLLAMQLHS